LNIVIQLSKFMFILLILLYCLEAYTYFRKKTPEKKKALLKRQVTIIFVTVILGYVLIFINTMNVLILLLGGGILVYFIITLSCYRLIYPKASMLLVNDMLMLLSIGFIIIARLDITEAVKQFMIAAGGTVIAFVLPVIVRKLKILPKLTWLYAILGIASLMVVLALAAVSGGAKLSLSVGGFTIQFSELVKITLVFFMASMLSKSTSFRSVLVTTIVAGLHVIILVLSTDLGTALVFFVTYLVMVFVATRKPLYTAAGLGAGVLAGIAAYFLFAHVRKRVVAWKDPFKVYDSSGYQIVQALFAIGAGGWFGAGLCQGSPDTIPVASKDFVFAAICEEFGSIFAICLILVCMSMFLLIVNISFEIHDTFYKLVALGLGTEYAFQVFLTIGGVTKFIPMTGITLPLVSYGGSSVMSTIIMLAIIQGLYILREDEGEQLEKA
jgi:cell division protein FtsW (lipid II flippase)